MAWLRWFALGMLVSCAGCDSHAPIEPPPETPDGGTKAPPPPLTPETLGGTLVTPATANAAWARSLPGYIMVPPLVARGPANELIVETTIELRPREQYHLLYENYLMRLDADTGELIWMQKLDVGSTLMLDPQGNILLLSSTKLVKLDPNGQPLWSRPLTQELDYAYVRLALDSQGNILLATQVLSKSPGTVGGDLLGFLELEKLDGDGNPLWSHRFGDGTTYVDAAYVTTDPDDNVVFLAAEVDGSIDFGGGPLTGNDVLAKYDANGNHLFSKVIGIIGSITYRASNPVQTDGAGNIFIINPSYGDIDVGLGMFDCVDQYVLKYDPAGNILSNTCAYADELALLADGSFIAAKTVSYDVTIGPKKCTVLDRNSEGDESALARYDATGTGVATSCVAEPGYQEVGAVALDPSGKFFMTAAYTGQLTLPDGTVIPAVDNDWTSLIAKVALSP